MLANALYGYLGKNNFSGYHYHPFHLTVNHLAILQTYYLYRQFLPQDVLAIRSDCIYVRGGLPDKFLKEAKKYQKYKVTKHKQVGFFGKDNIFIYDNEELKSFNNNPSERKKLAEEFLNKQLS